MTETAAVTELCLLRIAVFGAMLFIDKLADADTLSLASLPRVLRSPIPAGGWIDKFLRFDNVSILRLNPVFRLSCLCAAVGFVTPLSTLLASVLAAYMLAIPSLFGGVRAFHHLWWFSTILFAIPCGTEFSVDSALGWYPQRDFPFVHALWAVRCVFGTIYFFPGVWKLLRGGLRWGETIYNTVSLMWFDAGGTPQYIRRFLARRTLLLVVGVVVMTFEISFPALIWFWPVAAFVTGIIFHLAGAVVLRIPFWHLQVCYVAMVPCEWLDWLALKPFAPSGIASDHQSFISHLNQPAVFYVVSGVVILGTIAFGILGIRSWPFAVYPTFAESVPNTTTTLIYAVQYDGQESCTYHVSDLLAKKMSSRRAMMMVNFVCRDEDRRAEKLEALRQVCGIECARRARAWRLLATERPVDAPQCELRTQEMLNNSAIQRT
ncbi:MAG: hypothetical protein ACYDH9_03820 [Limisphaerales bacterium]